MSVIKDWRARGTRTFWHRLTPDEQWAEVARLLAEVERLKRESK